MGKSRLALQLCDWCNDEHWLSGFVVTDRGWPESWTPVRDTLAVLDYAAFRKIGTQPASRWLESVYSQALKAPANSGSRQPRVRIILIDRTKQGPLWFDLAISDGDLKDLTLPVQLEPDRAEFDEIVKTEFLRRTGRNPSAQENQAIASLTGRLRQQFRPLFALLTAAAVADATVSGGIQ